MEVLRLENLSKYYTSENSVVMGLSGINLSFSTGEFVALTGESGSGKSTLAHVLGGILPYEAGELYIYGQPTSHYDAPDWERYRRDLISFVSQSYGILPGNTVCENVEGALRLGGLSPEEAAVRADEILGEVELSEFKKRKAGKLSSGQKQRLSIARALAKPSKILIADEPTGNLDRENSENVIKLLKRAAKDRLVILITHEFEEAKDVATRRIVLSDGQVATDERLSPKGTDGEENIPPKVQKNAKKLNTGRPLAPYITYLTIKSRPIFTTVLTLFLAVTTFITFVFLGTFTVALDDSSTRSYDDSVFKNGDMQRIVIMKDGGEDFTEEDYKKILSVKYAESLEKWGYTADIQYHYKEGVDYRIYDSIIFGENYHPVLNPDDYTETKLVEFYETEKSFFRTLPYAKDSIITDGHAPEGFYEVVSADPKFNTGDTVTVYFRNRQDFGASAYIRLTFLVVGESSYGEGLYFSTELAAMLNKTVAASRNDITQSGGSFIISNRIVPIFAPYNKENFKLYVEEDREEDDEPVTEDENTEFVLGESGLLIPEGRYYTPSKVGDHAAFKDKYGEIVFLTCEGVYTGSAYPDLFAVTEEMFERMTDFSLPNQVSLYIKDYSYTDRVIKSLSDEGYIAISPYKLGSTETISGAASERLTTLAICIGAVILSFVLQSILLRAMFNSLNEYFRLLSNIGLGIKTASCSMLLSVLAITLASDLLGGALILTLNGIGVSRIADIFKYLDTGTLIILFAVHFISVMISLIGIIRGLRKNVFGRTVAEVDIDFSEMEEGV